MIHSRTVFVTAVVTAVVTAEEAEELLKKICGIAYRTALWGHFCGPMSIMCLASFVG